MKTIKINRKTHRIPVALERVIMSIANYGPSAVSDFTERRQRGFTSNAIANLADPAGATAGALEIRYSGYSVLPDVCKDRPRVKRWVVPTSIRRLNLVASKLRAAN
jgi:hypothetical protein